jgi:hypothetical protein
MRVLRNDYRPAVASCEDTLLNVVLSCEPSELTTAIIATEIPAAIKPYSMAVAPDSSLTKRLISLNMSASLADIASHVYYWLPTAPHEITSCNGSVATKLDKRECAS